MAADLDMDASGAEGWGDDAELQLDEGKHSRMKYYYTGGNLTFKKIYIYHFDIKMHAQQQAFPGSHFFFFYNSQLRS